MSQYGLSIRGAYSRMTDAKLDNIINLKLCMRYILAGEIAKCMATYSFSGDQSSVSACA